MTLDIIDLNDARHHARDWLLNKAAPLWSHVGLCPDGMFAERIDLGGNPVSSDRRVRVQPRQIYSFCAIGSLGWDGPWQAIATKAIEVFIHQARREDGLFGHMLNAEGRLINPKADLYDQAFCIFAFAHAGVALDRPELFDIAESLYQHLEDTWWRSPNGGFNEGDVTPCPPYRQNPHMHMFEAALANFKATGKPVWRERADRLAHLFETRFWHPESGAVTEFFEENWTRLAGDEGQIVEPGHCLEWAWLFEVGTTGKTHISDGLVHFARQYGIASTHDIAINEVYVDGRLKDGAARLWPQTERLKASLARYNRTGDQAEHDEAVRAYRGLIRYFDVPVSGLWRDRLLADGSWLEEAAPASSFYHIVCALVELLHSKSYKAP